MSQHSPPRWLERLLLLICDRDQVEFIVGDLQELYEQRFSKGHFYANASYAWDVIRSFHWSIFTLKNSTISMFKSFLKIGFRSLLNNWSHALINTSGLALSVGCAITTFLFADFFFNLNGIHENKERTYQLISHLMENDQEAKYGPSAMILAERLEADHPTVEATARVQYLRGNVRFGVNVFNERIMFADASFFDVFDFPMLEGSKATFVAGSVFISSDVAKKYFGNEDPMGQRIDIKFAEAPLSFTVAGVFAKPPMNTTFRPHILVPMPHYMQIKRTDVNWGAEAKATFVLLDQSNSPELLDDLLIDYRNTQNKAVADNQVISYELVGFDQLSSMTELQDTIVPGNSKEGTIGIAVTGLLLILFACLNYVNIAISSAHARLKEIGVRKVMGSSRASVAMQFLTENFIVCLLAMVVGVILCYFLLLPGFNQLSPVEIPFAFSSVPTAIGYFIGLFLLLGILSGSYPAFHISKYQSLQMFKGEQSIQGSTFMSRILLTFQFALGLFTILVCFIFTDQTAYIRKLSWGYEPAGLLAVTSNEPATLEELEVLVREYPDVSAVHLSTGHLGIRNELVPFKWNERQFKTLTYDVSPGYVKMMGIPLIHGDYFDMQRASSHEVIVNEAFVKEMGWKQPLSETFEYEGSVRKVVGVVSDVYHVFFDADIQRPAIFTIDGLEPNFLVLKAPEQRLVAINEQVKDDWSTVADFTPYTRFFQADSFDRGFQNVDANNYFMLTLSVFTIFLSSLGLYGLLAVTLFKRIKEFSIRKVLGASSQEIIQIAFKEFRWILLIAFGIGAPAGYFLMGDFVKGLYTVSKPIGWMPVVLSVVILLLVFVVTVFAQLRQVIKVNPAEILKGD